MTMKINIQTLCIPTTATIRDAIDCLERNLTGIALVVDEQRHLLGTVVDGDVRRAMLRNVPLNEGVQTLLETKPERYRQPTSAPASMSQADLLKLMQERSVRHVPLLNDKQQVVDIFTLNTLVVEEVDSDLQAVLMAGGRGMRLRPLTQDTPKPMLPIGDRPLLQRIIEQLRQSGVRDINITTNYLAEKIKAHFGDGDEFGVNISYVEEDHPLGTAGGIGLIPKPVTPLLVMNGDLLTRVNFKAMLAYHREQEAMLTIAVRSHEFTIPYGVVESRDGFVTGLTEKPVLQYFVNAGIYLLQPEVHDLIPKNEYHDMTTLIDQLMRRELPVASFPIHEYWLDIGQHEDYLRAQQEAEIHFDVGE